MSFPFKRKTSRYEMDSLLVYGYIHNLQTINKILLIRIPDDIIKLLILFYHLKAVRLTWSKKWCHNTGLQWSDNGKIIKRMNVKDYTWVQANTEPIFEGIKCWRLKIFNPNKGFILFGICEQQQLINKFGDDQSTVWGIGRDGSWYFDPKYKDVCTYNRRYDINHNKQLWHFGDVDIEVDIYINVDMGHLHICVVGNNDKDREARFTGLPQPQNGYVPFIAPFKSAAQFTCKIAMIPNDWCRKKQSDNDIFN